MGKKIPAKIKKSVRFVALDTLERVNKGGAYSNLLLNDMMSKAKLSEKDGRLYTELVYGTISRRLLLEFYLQPFIAKAKKVDDWVVTLLCLSLYQLEFLDKVPAHAVLNEAVEIGKARGNVGIGKFVNGVLRSIQREGLPKITSIKDPMTRLSVEISMPLWLTKKLVEQLGVEETLKLGLSLFEVSHVSARVDTRMVEREEVIATLEEEEGIFARESVVSPYGVVAEKGYLANSRLFQYGLMTIQDESSMLVAPAMQIQKHHKVLDACAAPGGKTTHIATFLDPTFGGEVTALDIHDHKVKLIEENARRLRVEEAIHAQKMDARAIHEQFEPESFDRILVDAPCSGLGLMRRKPDIKYHKKLEDFLQLQKIQLEILESAAPTLKHSGIMTYSTCTITKEENQEVIETFLAAHPEFEKVEVTVNPQIQDAVSDDQLTLYPHQYMTDGFFICCLRKK
ncbi:ribosomal RNA small subunit methyltransferase B [Enterococcus phoeniculicola]|jgi:16S rRNA (cytosine967-C5)-methyltransferase|uniref:16S rRNA (cytosine(967)-C(5))-methyltransferase n=1 Tax=Enterococcus phoeniculicola ATCC BAA-412 TaxID=1158610 RepID=R3WNX5_9ENTE|nr:16S rRNA (cytosine(967)-C(5))-methyltransferase RsmB [Enterococcus phoeniculicola]EOL49147.1 ribosomal RNA small subunit methyltransferase B [Enterococcus phoeniculicola ATCC BAA-412]EOT70960.1 ribosomal RNA small subunit methyltransferase B [Enterococcus phoeniculicola ATCC BAA-412]OJG70474.1 ribosomal RNA small subunit methyltransferase B [Enterococcus phoeniculicola]